MPSAIRWSSASLRSSSSGPPMSPIERVAPLGAAPGRSAIVDGRDGEPRVHVGLDLGVPAVLVEPGRTAVGADQDRPRTRALGASR